jgi:hypothetical protein
MTENFETIVDSQYVRLKQKQKQNIYGVLLMKAFKIYKITKKKKKTRK